MHFLNLTTVKTTNLEAFLNGHTIEQISAELGVSKRSIYNWKYGRRPRGSYIRQLIKMAKANGYKLSVADFRPATRKNSATPMLERAITIVDAPRTRRVVLLADLTPQEKQELIQELTATS